MMNLQSLHGKSQVILEEWHGTVSWTALPLAPLDRLRIMQMQVAELATSWLDMLPTVVSVQMVEIWLTT
jgi:hypothetical protein